ncbi:MAG TPA: ComEC/Rec2 family competence protein, partial [Nevskiaceae bacterium]|nr:ComEC/Rec2 family competence protein [Nevskiaceae bacterium]
TWPDAWIPAAPPVAALALGLLGALLVFAPRGAPLRALGLACVLPLFVPRDAGVRGPFELTVLDVGQGLSAIVETRHHVLVFDAGPAFEDGFDAGTAVVVPALLARGHRHVDRLVLSHADLDHAGGVPGVRSRLDIRDELGTPGHPACADGQAWEWDGVRFEVLHPHGRGASENDDSCVLRVSSATFSALLAGDIERGAEARLLRDHRDRLQADVLVAPHHGSLTSSSPAFVAAVRPSVVVFAAAWRSRFGHPRAEVVQRYAEVGARPLTTGVEGAIRLHRDAAGAIRTESWRRLHPRYWNAAPEP